MKQSNKNNFLGEKAKRKSAKLMIKITFKLRQDGNGNISTGEPRN